MCNDSVTDFSPNSDLCGLLGMIWVKNLTINVMCCFVCSQLQQAETAREAEMTDLNTLTEEFTRRMGESERKLQAALRVSLTFFCFR